MLALFGAIGGGIGVAGYVNEQRSNNVMPDIRPTETPPTGVLHNGANSEPSPAALPESQPIRSLSRGETLSILVTLFVGILTAIATLAAPFLSNQQRTIPPSRP
jgi:hypothetical protein